MTDADLQDLFHSAAPDPDRPDPDVIDRAWHDGSRRRVGARAAVLGSIAATAAIVAGFAMLDPGATGRVAPSPAIDSRTSTPTTAPAPRAERAGDYAGAPVWWAPSVMEEAELPELRGAVLPRVIDLDAAEAGAIGEPVVALFSGRGDRAFALTASGRVVEIDTSRLDPVTDEGGNGRNPLSSYSLSGDRLRVFFVQNSSIEVLDALTGEWTTVDTPDWRAEGARWVMTDEIWVPEMLGDDSTGTVHRVSGGTTLADVDWVRGWSAPGDGLWGPVAAGRAGTAQMAFVAGPIPGGSVSNPQALMVDRAGERSVLALDYGGSGEGTRGKGCCVALGWLDRDTVLFSSSGTEGQRILAWDVASKDVYLVSEILGPAGIVALADPGAS